MENAFSNLKVPTVGFFTSANYKTKNQARLRCLLQNALFGFIFTNKGI